MSKLWPILGSQIELSFLRIFPDRTFVSVISNSIFFTLFIIPLSRAYDMWPVPVSKGHYRSLLWPFWVLYPVVEKN
jgi:hypothetical protein